VDAGSRQENASKQESEAFGVYVHWPFCLSKCPYCDFNSHVRHAAIDEPRFASAFAREIAATAERAPGREVTAIFLGGGTPSLMQPATVGAVLDANEGDKWRIGQDRPLTEALSSDAFAKLGAVMAVDREGVLRGVLTAERVRRALQSAFGTPA
jgi:oxygen-independent coproporphyrinogen-3 oxidase